MYPEISRDRMHTLADLEEAVGQAARKGHPEREDTRAHTIATSFASRDI